jgi:hypothetical protein
MFLDLQSYEPRGPRIRLCRSCNRIIQPGTQSEQLHFNDVREHRLSDLSGTYHAACARPYLGLKRALNLLEFHPF